MKAPDAPPAIPAPTDKDQPFPIRDEHTVYEAAMAYAGRHPYPHDFGAYDRKNKPERCLTLLKLGLSERLPRRQRAQRSWDIFCELGERIRCDRIKPIRIARDLAGEIDLVDTVIATADLAQLAIDRHERPRYLRHMLRAADDRAPKRPLTKLAADEFAADYITSEKQAGRRPTMMGLERAAADAKLRGGRAFLRDAYHRRQDVKVGRPTKFAKK
jgi:hypothetical protein